MVHLRQIIILFILGFYSWQSFASNLVIFAAGQKLSNNYQIAGYICRLVNKNALANGTHCSALATQSDKENIELLQSGKVDFAIVNSLVQHKALEGINQQQVPFNTLRSVFSLYTQSINFIVKNDSFIMNFDQIKGKEINLGIKHSSERQILEKLFALQGWNKSSFKRLLELNSKEQGEALCHDIFDMMLLITSHPSKQIKELETQCQIRLLSLNNKLIDKLTLENNIYQKDTIPAGTYSRQNQNIDTISILTTVVTRESVDEDIVYNFAKSVFQQLNKLKVFHPSLSNLNEQHMLGLVAPLHAGAARYLAPLQILTVVPN